MTVLEHARWFDDVYVDCLETLGTSGSLIRIAVAGTVLGIRNVPGSDDENTAKTVPPVIPDERNATSGPTSGFWENKIYNLKLYQNSFLFIININNKSLRKQNLGRNFLTVRTEAGRAPPPPSALPGCSRPWGGNLGSGGGERAAKAMGTVIAAATAGFSWRNWRTGEISSASFVSSN